MAITDGQVRIGVEVLRAYINEELSLDDDIREELEQAIEQAFDALCAPIDCEIDDEPPLTETA